MATLDYHRFMRDKWGDPDRLTRFLHNYGHREIPRATVNQWFRRKSIPAEHFGTLVALLEVETGAPVSMAEYLQ